MKAIVKLAVSASILTLFIGAFGSATKCPVCHMDLATKSSTKNPVAVQLKKGGPVLYCCAHCKMPAAVLVKKKK